MITWTRGQQTVFCHMDRGVVTTDIYDVYVLYHSYIQYILSTYVLMHMFTVGIDECSRCYFSSTMYTTTLLHYIYNGSLTSYYVSLMSMLMFCVSDHVLLVVVIGARVSNIR